MKKIVWRLALLSMCTALGLGQASRQDLKGRSAVPVFNDLGDLYVMYENDTAVHFGHIGSLENEPAFHFQRLLQNQARHPDVKKGSGGKIWAVWEGTDQQGSHIFLSSLGSDSQDEPARISGWLGGSNSSPSLAVDKNGFPWIAWINNSQDSCRIFVFRQETGQTWQANSILNGPVLTPRIVVGDALEAWVIWVSQYRGPGEIFGRRLSDNQWSVEYALNSDHLYPHFDPEVVLDGTGRPWIVWAGWDGEDYEIYSSHWTGTDWTPESLLTDNKRFSDLSPSLLFLSPGNQAVLVWSQASAGSRICLQQFRNGKWGEIRYLSLIEPFNRKPKIAPFTDRIAITWESSSSEDTIIRTALASIPTLDRLYPPADHSQYRTQSPFVRHKIFPSFFPSFLNPARISAFGDSITYGVVNRTWFPDKGYVPRLDILIKSLSSSFHVINRGIPGERTAEGLARIEEELTTYRAKYMLLMEGTNDMSGGVSSQVAAFNMGEMIKKCFQHGVYPLLGTVIPRADPLWEGDLKQNTLLLNALLRNLAFNLNISLTDHYENFMTHATGYLDLFSDGAHPNETGYQKIAEAWFQSIDRIPWPPVNLTVERKVDKLLFYDEAINELAWEENSLLSPGTQIARYTILRKTNGDDDSDFVAIASVSGSSLVYTDREISPDLVYSYCIRAEDGSGLVGPLSSAVSNR